MFNAVSTDSQKGILNPEGYNRVIISSKEGIKATCNNGDEYMIKSNGIIFYNK